MKAQSNSKGGGISGSEIGGIIGGAASGILILGILLILFCHGRKRSSRETEPDTFGFDQVDNIGENRISLRYPDGSWAPLVTPWGTDGEIPSGKLQNE